MRGIKNIIANYLYKTSRQSNQKSSREGEMFPKPLGDYQAHTLKCSGRE